MKASVVRRDGDLPTDKIIIAKFEHGYLQKGSFDRLNYTYKKPYEESSKILTVNAKDKLSYVSQPLCHKGSKSSQYYVGCLNKRTGKMSIHDAEMMLLKPTFEEDKVAEPVFDQELSYKQQMDRLSAAFGSAKKKMAVKSRQRFDEMLGDKYNAAMDMSIEHAISQPDVTDSPQAPKSPSQSDNSLLPPFNRDATRAEDVFTAANMISSHTMVALKTPAEVFFKRTKEQLSEWTDTQEYPWFVLDELKVMPADDNQRWLKAKSLMYMNYLLTLFHYKPANFKKFNCLPAEWPEAVKKDLLDQFTMKSIAEKGQKPVRYFPARLKDKLLLYIMAMSLAVTRARLDPDLLIQDVGVPAKKVSTFYRTLGCKVIAGNFTNRRKESGEPTVTLKLPLKLLTDVAPRVQRDSRKRNLRQ